MFNYGYNNPNLYTETRRKMKVNGSASVKAEPTMAIASLGVVTENMSLEEAQRENALKTTSVINSLYSLNIPRKDISTASFDIQPQYDYIEGKQEFRGYRVTNILSIIIRDLSMVGEVIDTATANGANRVDNISFSVEDPSLYYNKALSLAVKSASEKARELANAFGVRLDPVPVKISEVSSSTIAEASPSVKLMAAPTPILPGQIDITAQIEVIFEYR